MEENIRYQSEFTYDLSVYKEFNKLVMHTMGRNTFMRAITALCILYLLTLFDVRWCIIYFLGLAGAYLVIHLVQYLRNRDGGLPFKQMLHRNGGQAPQQVVRFESEGVRSFNPNSENTILDPYANVRYLMESKNLLVLVTELKMCHIVDKRTLEGGTLEELIAYLRENCPRLKKGIRKGILGRIINWLVWGTIAIGIVLGIALLLNIPQRFSGQLTNDVSYADMAEELAPLGITISQQAIEELEAFDAEYEAEHGDYYAVNTTASKVFDLIYWEACGFYDEETWEWTPSESGVYWFDTEVYYLDSIYSTFLLGVDSMSEDLSFTNVVEDYTGADIEEGTGTIGVSFDYNGTRYSFDAAYNYDWFDTDMLYEVGRILAEDDHPADLWFTDDGQAILLYYGTGEQKGQLEKITGLTFYDCITMRMGH